MTPTKGQIPQMTSCREDGIPVPGSPLPKVWSCLNLLKRTPLKDQIQQTQKSQRTNQNNPIIEWTKTNLLYFVQIIKVGCLEIFSQHTLPKKSYLFSVQENLQIPPTPPPRF